MSRLTLTQRHGLNRYRDVQTDAHRTTGQARAEAQHWGERSAFLARQIPEPAEAKDPAAHPALGYAALWGLVIGMCLLFGTAIGHAILDAIWSY